MLKTTTAKQEVLLLPHYCIGNPSTDNHKLLSRCNASPPPLPESALLRIRKSGRPSLWVW